MTPNIVDEIEGLIKTIGMETNKLIREVEVRVEQTDETEISDARTPWIDFEKEATTRLGFSDLGWKSAFENQTGFKEGTLKGWNQKGYVPIGIMYLCGILKNREKREPAKKLTVGDDEKAAVAELHAAGKSVVEMRKAMNERFGDRRNYLADGPILGIMQRLGLKAKR